MPLPARTKPAASHQVSAVHTRCHCWERSARAVPVLVVPGDFLPGGEVLHSPVALGMKCWAMTPFRLHPEQAGEQTSLPFAPECWDGLCSRVRAGRVALQAACWPGACFPSHTQLSENSAFCGCGTSARTWVLSCSPAAGVMEVPRRSRLLLACLSSQLGFSVAFQVLLAEAEPDCACRDGSISPTCPACSKHPLTVAGPPHRPASQTAAGCWALRASW